MYAEAEFIGRATRDAEACELPSGIVKADFGIAVNLKKDETVFFELQAFDKLAELCSRYVTKGKLIFAKCTIRPRSYEDRNGNKKYVTDYIIKELKLLSSDKPQEPAEERPRRKPTLQAMDDDSDIPF